METKKDILNNLKRSPKPVVPIDFFDSFYTDLMARIENESGIIGQLKKREKPEIPSGYFDSILPNINLEENNFSLESLKKHKKPAVPPAYFENTPGKIIENIEKQNKSSIKKGRIVPIRIILTITAVAAAIAIFYNVMDFGNKEVSIANVEIDHSISVDDSFDSYLAFLDEDDIIDFIVDNDIEIEDSTNVVEYDDFSEFSEEDIEDYYLELL